MEVEHNPLCALVARPAARTHPRDVGSRDNATLDAAATEALFPFGTEAASQVIEAVRLGVVTAAAAEAMLERMVVMNARQQTEASEGSGLRVVLRKRVREDFE